MFIRFCILFLSTICTFNLCPAKIIENMWIPMSDGTRLAARVWIPDDADQKPVPVILEYLPYRKRDGTRQRDEGMYNWLVNEGYSIARVDIRGSGDSEGFLDDEYLKQEQDDAIEVIDFLAKQPWSNGNVGMTGKSWGGFNSLQVAARNPKPLKAIITVGFTDDRFRDDIHYMGGALLNDNLWWGAIMMVYQALPLDPEITGDSWKDRWFERIDHLPFWPALWMVNQSRNEYWKHGSICEDWGAFHCPVMAIGGWADAYTDPVFRVMENLNVPNIAIVGPWGHHFPHTGIPGPKIGYLQEAKRWWDHWLKEEDNGIMEEPQLRAYIEQWSSPGENKDPVPGQWVSEKRWKPEDYVDLGYYLTSQGLRMSSQNTNEVLTIDSSLWAGLAGGEWLRAGVPGDEPDDQQIDDAQSLVFDSPRLTEDFEILGFPKVKLKLASSNPHGQLCLRLCEVNPSGVSKRVSYMVLNLAHINGSENPEKLVPGKFYEVSLPMQACGYKFSRGNKIRLALSNSYWPMVWPPKELAKISLDPSASSIHLPIRKPSNQENFVSFMEAVSGVPFATTHIADGQFHRLCAFDTLNKTCFHVTSGKNGIFGGGVDRLDEVGITSSHNLKRVSKVHKFDPLTAKTTVIQEYSIDRKENSFNIKCSVEMVGNENHFILKGTIDIFQNGLHIKNKKYRQVIPREFI